MVRIKNRADLDLDFGTKKYVILFCPNIQYSIRETV